MVPQVTVVETLPGSENELSLKTGYVVANCHTRGSLLVQGVHQHTQHTLHDLNCSLFLLPSRELLRQKFVGVAASDQRHESPQTLLAVDHLQLCEIFYASFPSAHG